MGRPPRGALPGRVLSRVIACSEKDLEGRRGPWPLGQPMKARVVGQLAGVPAEEPGDGRPWQKAAGPLWTPYCPGQGCRGPMQLAWRTIQGALVSDQQHGGHTSRIGPQSCWPGQGRRCQEKGQLAAVTGPVLGLLSLPFQKYPHVTAHDTLRPHGAPPYCMPGRPPGRHAAPQGLRAAPITLVWQGPGFKGQPGCPHLGSVLASGGGGFAESRGRRCSVRDAERAHVTEQGAGSTSLCRRPPRHWDRLGS